MSNSGPEVYIGGAAIGQFVQSIAHWILGSAATSSPNTTIGTNSLERALTLLEMVEKTPGGLRHAEISRRLRIPKSTCSWILTRLERQGYLMCDEDTSRYKIGLKTIALAHGALRELGFRTWAEPVLYRIASETGLAAGIGVLEGGQVLVVDRVEAPEFSGQQRLIHERPRDQREIGRELPAHSTALGKVLLAYLSRNKLLAQLSDLELTPRTPKTIVSGLDFLIELKKIRRRGYATSDEEHSHGVRAISAPIFDFTGAARAAISLNGSPKVPIWKAQRKLIASVTLAARDISRNAHFLN